MVVSQPHKLSMVSQPPRSSLCVLPADTEVLRRTRLYKGAAENLSSFYGSSADASTETK